MRRFQCLPQLVALLLMLAGCGHMKAIVDPVTVKDQGRFTQDQRECEQIAKDYELTGEKTGWGLFGGAAGGGLVAGGAALAFGAVFPPAIPFIVGAAALGATGGSGLAKSKETEARESIFLHCITDRGYTAYAVN